MCVCVFVCVDCTHCALLLLLLSPRGRTRRVLLSSQSARETRPIIHSRLLLSPSLSFSPAHLLSISTRLLALSLSISLCLQLRIFTPPLRERREKRIISGRDRPCLSHSHSDTHTHTHTHTRESPSPPPPSLAFTCAHTCGRARASQFRRRIRAREKKSLSLRTPSLHLLQGYVSLLLYLSIPESPYAPVPYRTCTREAS